MKRSIPPPDPVPRPRAAAAEALLRILLVRDPFRLGDDDVEAIRRGLADAGYELVEMADADLELPRVIERTQPDLLIIESATAARDLVEYVCVSTQHAPRPIVLFTDNADNERIRASIAAGITAYIVDGLKADTVKSVLDVAYARFQFERQLRAELDEAVNQLRERKVVDRAKGWMMRQYQISEDEAYQRLSQHSMDKNIKIAEAAKLFIAMAAALDWPE